jgi:hypothetical protein
MKRLLIAGLFISSPLFLEAGSNTIALTINRAVLSGSASPDTDLTPPSAVTNLSALANGTTHQLNLSWTSPGDDAGSGTLTGTFRIFYSSVSGDMSGLTGTSSTSGTLNKVDISTSGVSPGTTRTSQLTNLTGGVTYYSTIFTADEVPNWSAISNGATAFTAAPVAGGWTSVGIFASSQSKTGADPWNYNTVADLEVGHVGIMLGAVDNDGDGTDTNDFVGFGDSASNTWTSAGENEEDPGSASAGAAVGVAYAVPTSLLATGGTVKNDYAASKNSKAGISWEFTIAGTVVAVTGTEQKEDVAAGDAGSLTVGSLANAQHLCVRAVASETGTTETITPTAGWTTFGDVGTTGSTDNTNMRIWGEFIIFTGTTATSDPTFSGSFDRASTMVCLDQS